MQYPQQRLAKCRCVLTVRHYAQQHDQQQPELVLKQHQHHKITKLMRGTLHRGGGEQTLSPSSFLEWIGV